MFMKIAYPIIFAVGLIGNFLNFYIFTRTRLKGLSTVRSLAYLSLVDAVYILIGIPHIILIIYQDYNLRDHSHFACSWHSFLTIYLSHLSSNLQAVVGVVRCVTVSSNKKLQLEKKGTAAGNSGHLRNPNILIGVVTFVLFLLNAHFLLWMRLSEEEPIHSDSSWNSTHLKYNRSLDQIRNKQKVFYCGPIKTEQPIYYMFTMYYQPIVDMFLYAYIPFIIMLFSTVLIVKRLLQISSQLHKPKAIDSPTVEQTNLCEIKTNCSVDTIARTVMNCDQKINKQTQVNFKPDRSAIADKRLMSYNQIYRLLLGLNIMFLVLVSPLVLCNYFHQLGNKFIRETVYLLAYLNHCLNSFVYGMSSQNYRTILFGILSIEKEKVLVSSGARQLSG